MGYVKAWDLVPQKNATATKCCRESKGLGSAVKRNHSEVT